jgi:predicted transcriptional regulator
MRCWRLLGYLLLIFILMISPACAQSGSGGYYAIPRTSTGYYIQSNMVSFWQMPDGYKLTIAIAMVMSFVVLLKGLPFVLGKIDDLLKNENRHNILNYVYSNPGATVAEVAFSQSIERGTAKYHLYKLESEGKIVLNRIGKYSRVFRNSNTYSDFEKTVLSHLQNQTGRSLLLLVLERPGITNQELAERMGIEKSAIHWHVDKFLQDGLISYHREGKFKRYFLGDKSRLIIEKFTNRPN